MQPVSRTLSLPITWLVFGHFQNKSRHKSPDYLQSVFWFGLEWIVKLISIIVLNCISTEGANEIRGFVRPLFSHKHIGTECISQQIIRFIKATNVESNV